ncbi:MAG: hypothetical protein LBP89_10080 [Helicobacteraceae bacterium]|jgi:hypothetical protein|nr:hypothetical protein [Helicobacteraceae bacterium]
MRIEKFKSVYFKALGADGARATEIEGEQYLFGDEVFGSPRYILNIEDLIRLYPLGLKWLVEKKGFPKTDKVAVSLPTMTYRDHKAGKEKGEDNVIDALSERIKRLLGYKEVAVVPQGVSALFHVETIDPDAVSNGKNILLIDGGFNTLNIALIKSSDSGYEAVYVRTYYDEFGVRDLLSGYLAPQLRVKYPDLSQNEQSLNSMFVSGSVNLGLKTSDIEAEKNGAMDVFLADMFQKVKSDMSKAKVDYQSVIFVGGLSHYIDKELLETDKILFLPPKPRNEIDGAEYYNVRGMAQLYSPTDGYLGSGRRFRAFQGHRVANVLVRPRRVAKQLSRFARYEPRVRYGIAKAVHIAGLWRRGKRDYLQRRLYRRAAYGARRKVGFLQV